jgi:hypothetical protein
MTHLTGLVEQLKQIADAGVDGVWAGDLVCKTSARYLIANGFASNTGGSPSSLKRVRATPKGRAVLSEADKLVEMIRTSSKGSSQ